MSFIVFELLKYRTQYISYRTIKMKAIARISQIIVSPINIIEKNTNSIITNAKPMGENPKFILTSHNLKLQLLCNAHFTDRIWRFHIRILNRTIELSIMFLHFQRSWKRSAHRMNRFFQNKRSI